MIEISESTFDTLNIRSECQFCKFTHKFEVIIKDYNNWQEGQLIENTIPYLTPGEIGLLVNKTCPICYAILF